jgi:hypothetical protein
MKETKKYKLSLKRELIRTLNQGELTNVNGGRPPNTVKCPTMNAPTCRWTCEIC